MFRLPVSRCPPPRLETRRKGSACCTTTATRHVVQQRSALCSAWRYAAVGARTEMQMGTDAAIQTNGFPSWQWRAAVRPTTTPRALRRRLPPLFLRHPFPVRPTCQLAPRSVSSDEPRFVCGSEHRRTLLARGMRERGTCQLSLRCERWGQRSSSSPIRGPTRSIE